jgi:SAM-dependent methyltransferase
MFGPRHLHRLALILRELRSLPRSSRVLDAACGLGQLASRLAEAGHRPVGADGEFAAALHTRRVAHVPAVVADMTRLPFRSETFDAITSGETLEHLDDDRTAVRELARVAHRGAPCVVTVPALQSLWSASDVYYEHRRRYSREQLVEVMRSGFDVERAFYWGFPVVLTYDTLFLLPMNKRRARSGPIAVVAKAGRSPVLVAIVRALFSADRLFRFVPFGPGLLLVARK